MRCLFRDQGPQHLADAGRLHVVDLCSRITAHEHVMETLLRDDVRTHPPVSPLADDRSRCHPVMVAELPTGLLHFPLIGSAQHDQTRTQVTIVARSVFRFAGLVFSVALLFLFSAGMVGSAGWAGVWGCSSTRCPFTRSGHSPLGGGVWDFHRPEHDV